MISPYVSALLSAIAAPTAVEKAALIAALPPPPREPWNDPPLPHRPGRPAHYREDHAPPRRRRTLRHAATRNRFLLAIHHIELSAVDLALVACVRGSGMTEDFHAEQLAVAAEEAVHAELLATLLNVRGCAPGCEPVHHRLWDATLACADLGEHLVMVPRFLEARGLDVAAELLPRLIELDREAHVVIARIYADEVRHVTIGTDWHRRWCEMRGLDAERHFRAVLERHVAGRPQPPTRLDHVGRAQAGFTANELASLREMTDQSRQDDDPTSG